VAQSAARSRRDQRALNGAAIVTARRIIAMMVAGYIFDITEVWTLHLDAVDERYDDFGR